MDNETTATLDANRVAQPFPQELTTERRLRCKHQHGKSIDLQFQAARPWADEIPRELPAILDRDRGAQRDKSVGGHGRNCERFVKSDVAGDLSGQSRLTFREIGRFLAVHVVLVFRTAFLADRLLTRKLGGTGLERKFLAELDKNLIANG